jgi:hypothetical protein
MEKATPLGIKYCHQRSAYPSLTVVVSAKIAAAAIEKTPAFSGRPSPRTSRDVVIQTYAAGTGNMSPGIGYTKE